jgi:phospholipase D1/2
MTEPFLPPPEEEDEDRSLKDRLEHPFEQLRQRFQDSQLHDLKVKATIFKHKIGKFNNLVNPNHLHDEEHEKETDRKRTFIAQSNRFGSFAPLREANKVKWYVDGRDYFWVCYSIS